MADDERALGKVALRLPGLTSPATECDAIVAADRPIGELSYWLLPHARGRGVADAAVRSMMESIAATTELRSVVLDIEVGNAASEALARRLGAERREPERIELDGARVVRTLAVHVIPVTR